ncbi:MAG: hypothetical protein ACRD4X_10615 [Candidatus Acidiferrales bacterium]
MDILAALKREEAKCEKQADAARQQLETVRAAMKILQDGITKGGKAPGRKKRVMSAAVRAKLSKKAKERWARIKAAKNKAQKAK